MSAARPSTAPAAPSAPPTNLDRALLAVASVVVLGAIMSILDATVVNVAVSTLARDFHTPLSTIQWIATGYTLALATVIPLTGWGADRFGTKRLYVAAIVMFVIGSALSGMAWSAGSLITFRVLQGLGGGMLMPVGMTILTRAAGHQRMGRVMAVIGIPMLLAPVCGPTLGGWLVESYSWRWIFYVNVPIGLIAVLLSLRVLPKDVSQPHHRLDWLGLVLLSPGLAAFIYGLAQSGSSGGFGALKVWAPATAGLLVLAAFVWHSLRSEDPLVDVRLFANRAFSASSLTLVLSTLSLFGGFLLTPLYLQIVRGESPMHTGLLLIPQGLGSMITMPIAGRLTDKTGPGRIVPVGMALLAGSFLALTQLGADTPFWQFDIALFVMGLGMGATMMPIMSGAMQTLRHEQVARGSTTLNIIQQVGASIGTAVLTVLLVNALASRLHVTGGLGATGSIPPEARARVLPLMAESFGATFWWATGFVVVAFVVAVALLPKQTPTPAEDAAHGEPTAAMLVP